MNTQTADQTQKDFGTSFTIFVIEVMARKPLPNIKQQIKIITAKLTRPVNTFFILICFLRLKDHQPNSLNNPLDF